MGDTDCIKGETIASSIVVELGEPSRYCCLIRVAHRIILPNILYNKHVSIINIYYFLENINTGMYHHVHIKHFVQPESFLFLDHQNIMRSFIILVCVGMALAGEDMFGMKKQQKQWAEHKAMESCFGENMMKTSLLKMKKAVVKCTGQDMPELDLPMYK